MMVLRDHCHGNDGHVCDGDNLTAGIALGGVWHHVGFGAMAQSLLKISSGKMRCDACDEIVWC